MLLASGGGNQASGGTPTHSTATAGFESSNAFDGSASTFWSTGSGSVSPAWIAYQFPAQIALRAITIKAGDTSARALRAPKDFLIQRSYNGTAWATVKTVTGETGWGIGAVREFSW